MKPSTILTVLSLALVAVLWVVAGDEVVQIASLEGVFLQREMLVGA